MSDWASVDPSGLLPTEVMDAVRSIASLASAALARSQEALKVASSPPRTPTLANPLALAAETLLSTLEALLTGTKLHVLAVPIQKTPPVTPPSRLPSSLGDMEDWLNMRVGASGDAARAYQHLVAGTGGNAGFYRAIAESMFNETDLNRPLFFNQSDAVTMAVMMTGAASYASASRAASVLTQLFRPSGSGSLNARLSPTPQNVRAKPVTSASGKSIAVKVQWDPPTDVILPPYFPGLSLRVSRYAVIRLEGPGAPGTRTVLDVFSTAALVEGMASSKGVVVAIGSGRNSQYLDTSPPPAGGGPAYYCVAWETIVEEPSGASTLSFDQVSAVVKVARVAPSVTQTGSSPSWMAYGAAADMIPAVADATQLVIERARTLVTGNTSPADRLVKGLATASRMAERLEARASDLQADMDRLAASLARPAPRMYATRVTRGSGGNGALLAEFSRRLGNVSDPGRPPFDNGEYVCGICIIAGAPRLADLAAIASFLDALFSPTDAANPLLDVIAVIDTVVTAEEDVVFGPGVRPRPPSTTGPTRPAGAAPEVIDPLTGRPQIPDKPVVSQQGVPVTSDDPRNPEQGSTNVVPLSDLC